MNSDKIDLKMFDRLEDKVVAMYGAEASEVVVSANTEPFIARIVWCAYLLGREEALNEYLFAKNNSVLPVHDFEFKDNSKLKAL